MKLIAAGRSTTAAWTWTFSKNLNWKFIRKSVSTAAACLLLITDWKTFSVLILINYFTPRVQQLVIKFHALSAFPRRSRDVLWQITFVGFLLPLLIFETFRNMIVYVVNAFLQTLSDAFGAKIKRKGTEILHNPCVFILRSLFVTSSHFFSISC